MGLRLDGNSREILTAHILAKFEAHLQLYQKKPRTKIAVLKNDLKEVK